MDFTQGIKARVYKFENVFDPTTPSDGLNTREIAVKSGSLTFDAILVTNDYDFINYGSELRIVTNNKLLGSMH